MEKLISMIDFVLEISKSKDLMQTPLQKLNSLFYYAKFLSQIINISMFIPAKLVDGEWVVLEKKYFPTSMSFSNEANAHFQEYETAKSNVLFEGFEVKLFDKSKDKHFEYIEGFGYRFYTKDLGVDNWSITDNSLKIIENLTKFNLTLTATEKKQIGL